MPVYHPWKILSCPCKPSGFSLLRPLTQPQKWRNKPCSLNSSSLSTASAGPDFLAKAGFIIASLTGNSNFPEPWPTQAPALAQLNEALNAYRDAYHVSLTWDTLKVAQRDIVRQALLDLLKRLPSYLELVAQGDARILATTGCDLRHDVVRGANSGLLDAPADFRVVQGKQSGTIDIHAAKLPGAGSYEVHSAQGDPNVEANWKQIALSTACSHVLVEGLTPGQTYWLRLRGIGIGSGSAGAGTGAGAGLWTDPASLIVV